MRRWTNLRREVSRSIMASFFLSVSMSVVLASEEPETGLAVLIILVSVLSSTSFSFATPTLVDECARAAKLVEPIEFAPIDGAWAVAAVESDACVGWMTGGEERPNFADWPKMGAESECWAEAAGADWGGAIPLPVPAPGIPEITGANI